jgi:hypothetical protein
MSAITTAATPVTLQLNDEAPGVTLEFVSKDRATGIVQEKLVEINFPQEIASLVTDYTHLPVGVTPPNGITLYGRDLFWTMIGVRMPHIPFTPDVANATQGPCEFFTGKNKAESRIVVQLAPQVLIPSEDKKSWQSVDFTATLIMLRASVLGLMHWFREEMGALPQAKKTLEKARTVVICLDAMSQGRAMALLKKGIASKSEINCLVEGVAATVAHFYKTGKWLRNLQTNGLLLTDRADNALHVGDSCQGASLYTAQITFVFRHPAREQSQAGGAATTDPKGVTE